MKLFCTIIFFHAFLTFSAKGQEVPLEVFQIRSLPKEGILLNKGWLYRDADSLIYASTNYDDKNWTPIDPTADILSSDMFRRPGIQWLRLHVSVDSSLVNEQVAAVIKQSVASEWFLDGNLIHRFGTMSQNEKNVVAQSPLYTPLLPLHFNDPGRHLLAVRFEFETRLKQLSTDLEEYPLIRMSLFTFNNANIASSKELNKLKFTDTFRIGVFFIIALLHLLFFIFTPSQKAYLFFFIYALFSIFADILQLNIPTDLVSAQFGNILFFVSLRIASIWLLTAMYTLLNQKKGWVYWMVVGIAIFAAYFNNWTISVFMIDLIISIELVRTGLKALKLNTRGAWIIAAGAICYMLFYGLFLIGVIGAKFDYKYYHWPLGQTFIFADLLYALGALSFPIATTIYIALDFAFTSQALEQNLREVKDLSKKTLEQELEKQQMLSQANVTLERKVVERTKELEQSLKDLTTTQAQLIQSEKMASLGELTAGIAHEIQNPLNFVNNFSEINTDLSDEILEAASRGDIAEVKAIAADIKSNQHKITEHGKRADSIVKGMLQHSRSSSGQREPQDINKLVDEYVRLAYHGFRAKEKDFNATLDLDFDPHAGSVNMVAQDIGRVLLNLLNNAFYAVAEKSKLQIDDYVPVVKVHTKKMENLLEIALTDNGNGIPEKVLDKVFQPFFTTKPTGQGTGLGLSLSYDIIKAHSGQINIRNTPGEGAEFIITLPIKT